MNSLFNFCFFFVYVITYNLETWEQSRVWHALTFLFWSYYPCNCLTCFIGEAYTEPALPTVERQTCYTYLHAQSLLKLASQSALFQLRETVCADLFFFFSGQLLQCVLVFLRNFYRSFVVSLFYHYYFYLFNSQRPTLSWVDRFNGNWIGCSTHLSVFTRLPCVSTIEKVVRLIIFHR